MLCPRPECRARPGRAAGRPGQPRDPRPVAAPRAGPADPLSAVARAGRAGGHGSGRSGGTCRPAWCTASRCSPIPGPISSIGTADGRPWRPGSPASPRPRLNGVARRLSTRTLIGEGWAVAAMTRPRRARRAGDRVRGGLDGPGGRRSGRASRWTAPRCWRAWSPSRTSGPGSGCWPQRWSRPSPRPGPGGGRPARRRGREAGRDGPVGPAAGRPVPAGRAAAADPAADVPALRGRVRDLGPAPLPAAGRGRGGPRDGRPVSWAEIAAGLGYADQAHLITDFRAAVGQTPAAYAAAQRPVRSRRSRAAAGARLAGWVGLAGWGWRGGGRADPGGLCRGPAPGAGARRSPG